MIQRPRTRPHATAGASGGSPSAHSRSRIGDGDKSPRESGDESPHSKSGAPVSSPGSAPALGCGFSRPRGKPVWHERVQFFHDGCQSRKLDARAHPATPVGGGAPPDFGSQTQFCPSIRRASGTVIFFTGSAKSSVSPFGVKPPPSTSTKIGLLYAHGRCLACGLVP